MKITNNQLKQIIKEELDNILNEQSKKITGSIFQPDDRFARWTVVLYVDGKQYRRPKMVLDPNLHPTQLAYVLSKEFNFDGMWGPKVTLEDFESAIKNGKIEIIGATGYKEPTVAPD